MLQLANGTGLTARLMVVPDRHGVDAALVIVKGAFGLRDGQRLAQQPAVVEADAWSGDPGTSPLIEASDLALEKPATDVLLIGSAHAPGGQPHASVDVSFTVGPVRKSLRACGARTWAKTWFGERPSAAAPFTVQPLTWAADDATPPTLEDPAQATGRRSRQHARPRWGCGPVPPAWPSRCIHAGTYDAAWQRDRAPFLPTDFDPRFFQVAPADQQAPGHLRGGEPIELVNCTREGHLRAVVPTLAPRCQVTVGGSQRALPLALDTLTLRPDDDRVDLVWRGLLPLGRRILTVTLVQLDV